MVGVFFSLHRFGILLIVVKKGLHWAPKWMLSGLVKAEASVPEGRVRVSQKVWHKKVYK